MYKTITVKAYAKEIITLKCFDVKFVQNVILKGNAQKIIT